MAAIQNERDLFLQSEHPRFIPPPIDPSLIPGYQDALEDIDDLKDSLGNIGDEINHLMNNSRDLRIYATTLTFTNTSGTTTPSSTTLTAVKGSGLTGTVSWSVVAGSATLSSSTGDSVTVTGSTISGRSATIRARVTMNGANYDAYVTLTRLGAIAASNMVNLTSQVTGSLAAGNVSGLGALALLNTVNLNTQTTGALNGITQVTNLGSLAYANSIAANQIGAGTLAAGVIYAGGINAEQITAGTLTGRTVRTSASGSNRVEMSAITNDLNIYTDGVSRVRIGAGATSFGAEIFVSASSFRDAIGATNSNLAYAAVRGLSTTGMGVLGITRGSSSSYSYAVIGLAESSPGTVAAAGAVGTGFGYDFYALGSGVNYGPFTGAHDAIVLNTTTGYEQGDIMVDVRLAASKNISDTLFEVAPSSQANQKSAVGVCAKIMGPLEDYAPKTFVAVPGQDEIPPQMCEEYQSCCHNYTYIAVNALGEGKINVCGQNGNLHAGDLIVCSDMPGKGMRQTLSNGESDDVVRAHTVARVRVDVEFDNPTDVKLVPCIYLCG